MAQDDQNNPGGQNDLLDETSTDQSAGVGSPTSVGLDTGDDDTDGLSSGDQPGGLGDDDSELDTLEEDDLDEDTLGTSGSENGGGSSGGNI